jgi:1-aminocyclopropane-1-carboxylate deaminase/D-cysteine desulfhydrase-like pyridoxal-dependent ACC family enzyme
VALVFAHLDRAMLATLPTPLEAGPTLSGTARSGTAGAGGVRLWVKRDDLTGHGGGGNKARKLEFLCGDAKATGSQALVTVGAAQSNHCRMTAAAGARLGLEVHLVLSGDEPARSRATGNLLLSELFGAQLHFTGAPAHHWGELEIVRESVTESLAAEGLHPYSIPIGGSTATGALGYALALFEMLDQFDAAGIAPSTVVFTSSSGGTHAGLLAGRAAAIAAGRVVPHIRAVGVAKGVNIGIPDVAELANETLALMGSRSPTGAVSVDPADVDVDTRWLGDDYAVPTPAGDEAIGWAARNGGWLMDRTYSGKGLSGLLGAMALGEFGSDGDVVFIHTGGWPALFAADGTPVTSNR